MIDDSHENGKSSGCEPPRYRCHLGCILLKTPAISLPTGDEYNSSLSDDIEPTSLTECADIRPGDSVCSGWGFLFLNLQV